MYKRLININLPRKQSAFLWGARKTGKSTFLKNTFKNSLTIDLLKSDEFVKYSRSPHLLREELLRQKETNEPIIIDEVQKIPTLLDEIHWLIENSDHHFILCGSSARKLKRGAANLLGGRAWRYTFYPFVAKEIPNFDLLQALKYGLVPSHYLSAEPKRSLKSYVIDYLKEEIQNEGIVRELPAFARFLDVAGLCSGEMINFTAMASECHVNAKTVKNYYQILEDTLIGYSIMPFSKRVKRELIFSTPKFYLFDVGIANLLAKRTITDLQGANAGHAFEHFILMELLAYRGINDLDFDISYWRTKNGLEVDFVLGNAKIAIEIKISPTPRKQDLRGLNAFAHDYKPEHTIVVCPAHRERLITDNGQDIIILPWQEFLEKLWNNQYEL